MTPRECLNQDYGRLSGFLRTVSLRLRVRNLLEIVFLLVSCTILVLLGSLFSLEMKERFPYLPLLYTILGLSSLAVVLAYGIWRVSARPSLERLARGLEEKYPSLRDDVTNSVLLFGRAGKDSGPDRISEDLIVAQVRKTAEEVSSLRPEQVVGFKPALRHLRLTVFLALTLSIVLGINPGFLSRSVAMMTHPLSGLPAREALTISVEPGESTVLRGSPLTITARTSGGEPDRLTLALWVEGQAAEHRAMTLEGKAIFVFRIPSVRSSFRYQAYKGRATSSVYRISAVDPPEITRMKLTLTPPDYTGLPVQVRDQGHIEALKGTLVDLQAEATKEIREAKLVLEPSGEPSGDPSGQVPLKAKGKTIAGSLVIFHPGTYAIHLKDELSFENPDPVHYQIRLVPDKFPEGEILRPGQDLEVSGDEILPIVYMARDDFGVTSVRLSYRVAGREGSADLKTTGSGRSVGPETFKWDLGSLSLTAGDSVLYRLEITDNDSVSGPKKGYSSGFTLSVRDEKARAAKEGEEAEKMAEALLNLLADRLEGTKDRAALTQEVEKIVSRVDERLNRVRDPADRFDLEALRRNLSSLKERMAHESEERITQEMERLALLAEDIGKTARMNEVEALAREIRNRQRRLVDFLSEQRGPLDKEAMQAAMKELKKLEELLRSVMETLGRLASRLPEDFVNSQELSGLDFQDLFKDLEDIQNRLASGDLAGALEAAQNLLQALSEMMAALGRAGAQAGFSPFDRLQGEMTRQAGELGRILAEQTKILKETEKTDKEVKSALPGPEETARLMESLRQMEKEAPEELESPDLKALLEKMKAKTPDPKDLMPPALREKFPPLSSRQQGLKEKTESLREKLEMLAQLFPGMDTEILTDLGEAGTSMGEASARLKGRDAEAAMPPEQEAIRRLSKSQQSMQQMAQQMAMRMQAGRWGYPLAYDPRPGWYYGPWVPMPTLPQPNVKRPLEKGYTGIDREEFDPPSKDAYKVPGQFREKVQDALKEGIPSPYKREVERYFKGLTE